MKLFELIAIVVVSTVWGVTNPLMKLFPIVKSDRQPSTTYLGTVINLDWRFALSFIFNQTGSVLFHVLLSAMPLSVVVPVVNSLTLCIAAATGRIIGEDPVPRSFWFGTALIIVGVALCMND